MSATLAPARLCGYNACRNPVRAGAGACHLHVGALAAASVVTDPGVLIAQREMLAAARAGAGGEDAHLFAVPRAMMGPRAAWRDALGGAGAADAATLEAISSAFEPLEPLGLEVPEAAEAAAPLRFAAFAADLAAALPGRTRVMGLWGMNRRTRTGRVQSVPDYAHQAVLIDHQGRSEVVVDAFVAAYAPVQDRSRPAEAFLVSGSTPFADIPYVTSRYDYVNGDHLWWDHWEADR